MKQPLFCIRVMINVIILRTNDPDLHLRSLLIPSWIPGITFTGEVIVFNSEIIIVRIHK